MGCTQLRKSHDKIEWGGNDETKSLRGKRKDPPTIEPLDKKRPKAQMDTNMEQDPDQPQIEGAKSASIVSQNGRQETPILNVAPTYGLQETHTTILPVTFYYSVGGMDHDTAVLMSLQMTSIYSILLGVVGTTAAGGAITKQNNNIPTAYASGVYAGSFPTTLTGSPTPAWRAYWENIYQYYHVKACHWEMTVKNTSIAQSESSDIIIGKLYEATSSASATNKVPTAMTLNETFAWKDMDYKIVHGANNDQSKNRDTMVLTGSYYPGMAHRNIVNDGDTKAWTAVSASPTLVESLNLYMWKAPLNPSSTLVDQRCNVAMTLKYVVQFKDLTTAARYPTSGTTTVTQTLPTNALQLYT